MHTLARRSLLLASALSPFAAGKVWAADDTLRLGHIVPQSGPLKSVAEPSIASVDLSVEAVNAAGGVGGKKLVISRYDSGSDPRQATVAARKLIEDDKVLAIVGPFSSGETQVAVNDAERSHIVMMPGAASVPGLSNGKKYLFRLAQDENIQFDRMLQALKQHNIAAENAGIVYISDEAVDADAGNRIYPALMDKYGIKHNNTVAIQYKTFDVSPQVSRLLQGKPDVVALAALTDSAAKVVHELRRQGYTGPVIGSQLYADPNIGPLMGKDGDGVMLMTGFWHKSSPRAEAFDKEFIARNAEHGIKKLGAFHTDAQCYDIVTVLAKAMTKAGVTGDPAKLAEEREAIRTAMVGISYSGVLGNNICFDGQDARLPGYAIAIKDTEWTLMSSFPAAACGAAG